MALARSRRAARLAPRRPLGRRRSASAAGYDVVAARRLAPGQELPRARAPAADRGRRRPAAARPARPAQRRGPVARRPAARRARPDRHPARPRRLRRRHLRRRRRAGRARTSSTCRSRSPPSSPLYVIFDIVPLRQVYDEIEWPVVVLLGSMIPLGDALETSGGTGADRRRPRRPRLRPAGLGGAHRADGRGR